MYKRQELIERLFAEKPPAIDMNRAHGALFIVRSAPLWRKDTVAEWSKAPGSGPGSKERGFKSHRCQLFLTFYFFST